MSIPIIDEWEFLIIFGDAKFEALWKPSSLDILMNECQSNTKTLQLISPVIIKF